MTSIDEQIISNLCEDMREDGIRMVPCSDVATDKTLADKLEGCCFWIKDYPNDEPIYLADAYCINKLIKVMKIGAAASLLAVFTIFILDFTLIMYLFYDDWIIAIFSTIPIFIVSLFVNMFICNILISQFKSEAYRFRLLSYSHLFSENVVKITDLTIHEKECLISDLKISRANAWIDAKPKLIALIVFIILAALGLTGAAEPVSKIVEVISHFIVKR